MLKRTGRESTAHIADVGETSVEPGPNTRAKILPVGAGGGPFHRTNFGTIWFFIPNQKPQIHQFSKLKTQTSSPSLRPYRRAFKRHEVLDEELGLDKTAGHVSIAVVDQHSERLC